MHTIAVIPARGGSKRIPRKNIRPFAGKPILNHTVEAALASGLFDRVIVSTDDSEIADVARRAGAEVPFLRGPELADDITPVSAVTLDVVNRLEQEGLAVERVAQLMPNCPLRNAGDIVASLRHFEDFGAGSQISVTRFGWQNPWWAMQRDARWRLAPLFPDQLRRRSQDLPELFCPTGAIWWASVRVLRQHGTFHIPDRSGWEIPWQRGVDIDTEEDWQMAELLRRMIAGG